MRAVLYDGPRSFEVKDVPVPEPGPKDVLIKVLQTGLCGTDLHIHEGQFYAAFPLIPGHEVVGTVEAVGAEVIGVKLGETVTVNPNINCGFCQYCREGRTLICENLTGLGTNWHGGFAEYLSAPFPFVYSVDGLDPDTAVFAEPASCALHGLETLGVRPGSSALVFGAGPTGLLLAQLLKQGGAASVTVAAPTAFKLARAAALGVDATVLMDRADPSGTVQALRDISRSGFDFVVEATGSTTVGELCVPLTRSGGTVLIYGVTGPDERLSLSPYDVFRREITVKGSFAEINAFPAAIAAMRTGRVRTDGLITHRFPLEDYGDALTALRADKSVHKIVVTP